MAWSVPSPPTTLVNLLDLDLIAVVDSPYLPSVSIVRDGVPYSPVRVYSGKIGEKSTDKIVVIVSEFEPPQEILKPLAWAIMDWVEDKGCRMVISPRGWRTSPVKSPSKGLRK